ncbi:MAG: glucose/sorbosone dehydrogenase [Ferruginibacter sp.]|nr:glucose/sorbosone dehydrogenase [Ferruginibacter sp.]
MLLKNSRTTINKNPRYFFDPRLPYGSFFLASGMKEFKILLAIVLLSACSNQPAEKATRAEVVATVAEDTLATQAKKTADGPAPEFNLKGNPAGYDSFQINLQKGLNFKLAVISGYKINVAAEGLKRLRFLSMSPDKRLFATDMFDLRDGRNGSIIIFSGWNEEAKRFEKQTVFAGNLHNPNQVAFYKNHIYIAETGKLSRYVYHAGDTTLTGNPEVLATFPDYGLSYKYGGWHLTRSIAFHNDKLYVSVGSSCNACIEKEAVRAAILEMNPDGTGQRFFARGLRNSVGIKWIGDQLWATGMGRDGIGADKPEDLFQQIERDGFYGWPYYFQYRNKVYDDPQFRDSVKAPWVKQPPVAFAVFKAHSAPLGFEYFSGFSDGLLKNSILVCLHGSTTVSRQRGNAVVKINGGNRYTEIVSGFLQGKTEAGRFGRPCDILMKDDRSFFITDDLNGVLYYVWR